MAALCFAACSPAFAEPSRQTQEFINAMKQAYQSQAGANRQAAEQINRNAQGDAGCQAIGNARANAGRIYVKSRQPVDPVQAIEKTTCFTDVMDIKVPTTGFGGLDFVIGQMGQYLQSSACRKSQEYWNKIKTSVQAGDSTGILSQAFYNVSGVTAPYANSSNPTAAPPRIDESLFQNATQGVISTGVSIATAPLTSRIGTLQQQILDLQQRLFGNSSNGGSSGNGGTSDGL